MLIVLAIPNLIDVRFKKHGIMEIQAIFIDEFYFKEEGIKLHGNATLDIRFKVYGNVKRDMGHFKIVGFSESSSYSLLSEYKREILVVKFESSYPTHSPPNTMFQLDINYELKVQRRDHIFPYKMQLSYSCRIPYTAVHERTRCIDV